MTTTFIEVPAVVAEYDVVTDSVYTERRPTWLQVTAIESWQPTSDRTRTLVTMLSGTQHRVDLPPDEFQALVRDTVVDFEAAIAQRLRQVEASVRALKRQLQEAIDHRRSQP